VIIPLLPLLIAAAGATGDSSNSLSARGDSWPWGRWLAQALLQKFNRSARKGVALTAFTDSVAKNFKPKWRSWFAVLTLQRVIMVTVQNLGQDKILKSVAQALIVIVAFFAQIIVKPFHNTHVNMLQTVFCFVLTIIALGSIPIRTLDQASVDPDSSSELSEVVLILENCIAIASFLPVVGFFFVGVYACMSQKLTCEGGIPGFLTARAGDQV
jgi:hypothetical protein